MFLQNDMSIILKSTNKSRELSVFSLFEILQEEYIVCELRTKIYPFQKHKEYWLGVMDKKKEKIIDIAKRNSLPCIFDDKRIKQDFEKRIIPDIGFPKFLYRNENQRLMQEKWDIHNYYAVNSEVKVLDENGKVIVGVIKQVSLNEKRIKIKIHNSENETQFDLETVTRIL